MNPMNIYLCGVGGQGIGMLSDVLALACRRAGYNIKGCDTHGLAQRHGTVVSHLRIGDRLYVPRVPAGEADLVVGLERLEALRAASSMLKESGSLVYYDSVYQPIHVRMGVEKYPKAEELERVAEKKNLNLHRVYLGNLTDPRMQNVALLGRLASSEVIPNVKVTLLEEALRQKLPRKILEMNLAVFRQALQS
jgi:indolepyruvate ferredoxin oxidoreductase, beta subunit